MTFLSTATGAQTNVCRVLAIALPIFAANAFLASLGGYSLLDNNEGLYAGVAREMLARGEFAIPYFDGLPYLEKPPLLFWLTALSFHLFGFGETAARLAPALASLAVVAAAVTLGWRTRRPLGGLIAGTVVATSLVAMVIGRTVYFDMLLTACLSWAVIGAYFGVTEGKRGWMIAAAAALALATLAKGFVALALGGTTMLAFLIVTRASAHQWRLMFDPVAICVYLAAILPWHVAAALERGEWISFYLYNEHIGRFLGAREPRDYYTGPFWYYLPRLFGYLAPWTVVLPLLILRPRRAADEPGDKLDVLLWCWFGAALLLFSAAGNKANYYMIVAVVPMALLIARRIAQWFEAGRSKYLWILAGAASAVIGGAMVTIDVACGPNLGELYPFCTEITPITYAPVLLVVACFVAAARRWRDAEWRPLLPFLLIAALSLPLRHVITQAAAHYDDRLSQRVLAEKLLAVDPARPIYVFAKLADISALPFYLGKPVDMVNSRDADLALAATLPEARGRFIDLETLDALAAQKPIFLVAERFWRATLLQEERADLWCVAVESGSAFALSNRQADCAR